MARFARRARHELGAAGTPLLAAKAERLRDQGVDEQMVERGRSRAQALGWPDEAPYDRILVSADGGRLPEELVAQLGSGGRMVIPGAGRMLLVERDEQSLTQSAHGHYRFVPLV